MIPDCIFCQIIKGELPCAKVYEDDRIISFLDINPVNAGHTLVLPKTHYGTIFEMPEQEYMACTIACRKIAMAVFRGTSAAGLNLLQNNFRPAGQLIDHVHFHLIPRYPQDKFLHAWPGKPYHQGELERVVKKIRAEF
ncbi:MAG: HIT family protein [Desulfobacteraceae bacterium]|nr:HIT family protein [Desulfobacteraceae bacterium]